MEKFKIGGGSKKGGGNWVFTALNKANCLNLSNSDLTAKRG